MGPELKALTFAPRAIDTSVGPAKVTVNFRVADTGSGATSFEIGFAGPSGVISQKASASFAAAGSFAGSVPVTFPPLSEPGTWTVSHVLLANADGYTRFLSGQEVAGLGFPETLRVTSATDTANPTVTAFKFAPSTLDLTAGPADLAIELEAADNLSGVKAVEVSFASPSGASQRHVPTRFQRPSTSAKIPLLVSFPPSSEAGTWRVAAVVVADAAGNTLFMGTDDLIGRGFPAALVVKKAAEDRTAPTLTAFRISPPKINVGQAPAKVRIDFAVADDISGAAAVQVGLVSPSGGISRSASADFPPATRFTGSATVEFLSFSEPGDWKVGTLILADAVGNTRVLSAEDLRAKDFPDGVTVTAAAAEASGQPSAGSMALGQATVFVAAKSPDDLATGFDVRAELYQNGVLAAETQALCITGLASNLEQAKKLSLVFESVPGRPPIVSDTLSLRILARIGTNPDGTKCSGPSQSAGLRLYYGTADWPSHLALRVSPDRPSTLFLHSAGGRNFLAPDSPTAATAASSEPGSLDFDAGNPWKEIGTWTTAR